MPEKMTEETMEGRSKPGASEKRESAPAEPPANGSGARSKYKVAIVAPTCFYYQVALFRVLAAHPRIELMVYFCSEEANRGEDVFKKFRTSGSWGVEENLLEGYNYKFLRNYSPWPSYLKSVIGLMNYGIWDEITRDKPDVVILMSWMNPTWWLAILACLYSRVPFLYLTDQNVQRDLSGPRWKRWLKRLLLGTVIFRLAAGFLCAGTENRRLYEYYGVPDHKLVPFAFSWGFDTLLQTSQQLKSQSGRIRAGLGIPEDSCVVLYCGRMSQEKAPMHLLRAYQQVDVPGKALVFVGDGQLRPRLEQYVAKHGLDSVYFLGFQDRNQIPSFYAVSDILVVPSDQETWGIVVNEGMCFGLPVIVSDQVGAAPDMVREGFNGYTFPRGDVEALAHHIESVMRLSKEERSVMGARSREIIGKWLRRDLAQSLNEYLMSMPSKKAKAKG